MLFATNVSADDFKIPANGSHMEQVEGYRLALNKLVEAENSAKAEKKRSKDSSDGAAYLVADGELERIALLWTPFISGSAKADHLKTTGHLLANPDGQVSPPDEGYSTPEPVVTLFLIIMKAVVADFLDKFGKQTQKLLDHEVTLEQYGEALVQLTPGLRILQDFRDQIIPENDSGEIAKMIRDPIKRPIEIIQNIRDGVINPQDNGEIAKVIRDPIKRPVEIVKDVLKGIFG